MKFLDYDEVDIASELRKILDARKGWADFAEWVKALLIVEGNRAYRSTQENPIITATYILPEKGDEPSIDFVLEIEESSHSGSGPSGDFDIDAIHIAINTQRIARLRRDIILDYVRDQNQQSVYPTTEQIAKECHLKKMDAHNLLVEICHRKQLVEPVPLGHKVVGYRLTNGQRNDAEARFRRVDQAEKRRMLLEESNVLNIKMMLGTLTSGYGSPSSNVPENLSKILGKGPLPPRVQEALAALRKEYGDRWSYAGD